MDVEIIKEKIPARVKNFPNYRLFLVWVKEADAKTIPALKKELAGDIAYNQKTLRKSQKNSRLGMKNTLLRAQAKYLDFLKSIQKFLKYL